MNPNWTENQANPSPSQMPTSPDKLEQKVVYPFFYQWPGVSPEFASQGGYANIPMTQPTMFMPIPIFNPFCHYYMAPPHTILPPQAIPSVSSQTNLTQAKTPYQLKPLLQTNATGIEPNENLTITVKQHTSEEPKKSNEFEFYQGSVVVYTHGTSKHSGRLDSCAGIGIYWADNHRLNRSLQLYGYEQTARRAEIKAAILAIKNAMLNGFRRVLICTDNYFVIQCATQFLDDWINNGWVDEQQLPIKNKDLFQYLSSVMSNMEMVEWNYVQSCPGLEEAKKLAQIATTHN